MADTGARTLRLLSLLQSRRSWTGAELAGRLGISVRSLRRDVERLRGLGYPLEAQRGAEGGYRLAAGAAMPPLVLDDEEAVALAVGLGSAAQAPVAGIAESSLRALAKLVQVMPPRLRRRVEAVRAVTVGAPWDGTGAGVTAEALTTVALACRDHERVRFPYEAAGGAVTQRHAEPHALVPLGRRWYLVAYDLDRGDWRSFRLDRLSAPRPTGARFAPRAVPGGDPAEFVRAGIGGARALRTVEVVAVVGADVARERIGRFAQVEDAGAGTCRIRIAAEDLSWAGAALAVLGAEFTVVGPPEFPDHLRAWAATLTRACTPAGPVPEHPGGALGAPGRRTGH